MITNQPEEPKIYAAVADMLTKVEAIAKGKKNQQQGFMFRGIDDVYNVLHPILKEARVFPACRIKSVENSERETKNGGTLLYTRIVASYRFYAVDGSYVSTDVAAEGMDSGDKATNKAMSAAYKYAILQILCIPTEAVDPDSETQPPSTAKKLAAKKPASKKPAEYSPAEYYERASKRILDILKQTQPAPADMHRELSEFEANLESRQKHFDAKHYAELKDLLAKGYIKHGEWKQSLESAAA